MRRSVAVVAPLVAGAVAGLAGCSAAAPTASADAAFLDADALAAEPSVDLPLGGGGGLRATRDLPAGTSRTVVSWPAGVCWESRSAQTDVEGARVVVVFVEDTSGQDACDAAQVVHGGVVTVEADGPATLEVRARH